MTATSVLLILVGLFIIINALNFVGVLQGTKTIKGTPYTPTVPNTHPGSTKATLGGQ